MKRKKVNWYTLMKRCSAVGISLGTERWIIRFYEYANREGIVYYRVIETRRESDAHEFYEAARARGFVYVGTASGNEDVYVRPEYVLGAKRGDTAREVVLYVLAVNEQSDPMKFRLTVDSPSTAQKVVAELNKH